MKIYLTADLHIGMLFGSYPEGVRLALRQARIDVLTRMIEQANEEDCDLFGIAGDLFDRVKGIAKQTITVVAETLKLFAGQAVLVLPGNHDYDNGMIDLWSTFREKVGDKVLFLNEERPYPLDDYGIEATVYPAPCHELHSRTNNLGWIKGAAFGDRFNIGVAHGAISELSPDPDNRYYNMSLAELNQMQPDLWLMGHTHVPYPDMDQVTRHKVFNTGTPEPDGLDCTHPGYAWIIESDGKAKRVRTGTYRFIDRALTIRDAEDVERMSAGVLQGNANRTLARITARGRVDGDTMARYREARERLRDSLAWFSADETELGIRVTPEKIRQEFTEGSFPQELLHALADDEDTLQLAYELIMEVKE